MPHKLFPTTRQTTEIRNAFANKMTTDIKLSKTQISKIIQSSGSFGSWLPNLGKKALTNAAIPLARDNLPGRKCLILLHPLNYIGITDYFKYERRFNGVFSRNNLRRVKDGASVINLDDVNSKGTCWV